MDPATLCGVGVAFAPNVEGNGLRVCGLVAGGPAETSGQVCMQVCMQVRSCSYVLVSACPLHLLQKALSCMCVRAHARILGVLLLPVCMRMRACACVRVLDTHGGRMAMCVSGVD